MKPKIRLWVIEIILILTALVFPPKSSFAEGPDTTPPSIPENLSGTTASESITLSWTASTDNMGVVGYYIYKNGNQIATTASTSYNKTGLEPFTEYEFTVSAYDEAGNISNQSTVLRIKTMAKPPCSIIMEYPSTTTTHVTWLPDPQDTNINHYEISYNGGPVYTTEAPFYDFTGLTPGRSYHLRFRTIHDDESVGAWSGYYYIMPPTTLTRRTLYVDQSLTEDITDGSYQVNPNDGLEAGNAYRSIKAALLAMNGGDIVILRGGRYCEGHIRIDHCKDGRSDRWSTLMSYPGEWAILDGENGGGTGGIDGVRVGDNANSGCVLGFVASGSNATHAMSYWKFERLEITGGANAAGTGAAGFEGITGPFWFRYCYIHDNYVTSGTNNPGGLVGQTWQDSIVEYCWFENNGSLTSSHHNCAHINIYSDYKANTIAEYGFYGSRSPANARNTYRYNIFNGPTAVAIKYKQCQLFSGRNPLQSHGFEDTYQTWGDKIHHNIFLGTTNYAIDARQDFVQIYNNIFDDCLSAIQVGEADTRLIYKAVLYNNTVLANGNSGISYSNYNYKYSFTSPESDLHGYAYNNLIDGGGSGWDREDLTAWRPTSHTSGTFNHFIIDRNFFYSPAKEYPDVNGTLPLMIGNGNEAKMTLDQYSDAHPGIEQWLQEYSSVDPVYLGTAEAQKYITRGSHLLGTGKTLADSGTGISHPYLNGVSLPSYIGATNPNDNAWVDGVLGLSSITSLQNGTAEDPSWIEGTISSNHPPEISPISAISKYEGELIQFDILVSDQDAGDTITLSSFGLPQGATLTEISDRTWQFTWQTDFASAGTNTVFFTANDGTANSTNKPVEIRISDISNNVQLTDQPEWLRQE